MSYSTLPSPALHLVCQYLSTVPQLRALAAVCRAWRLACKHPAVWLPTCHVDLTYAHFRRGALLQLLPSSLPYLRSVTLDLHAEPGGLLHNNAQLWDDTLTQQVERLVAVCPHVSALELRAVNDQQAVAVLDRCRSWRLSVRLAVSGLASVPATLVSMIQLSKPLCCQLSLRVDLDVPTLLSWLPAAVHTVHGEHLHWQWQPERPVRPIHIGAALTDLRMQVPHGCNEWMHALLQRCVSLQRLRLYNPHRSIQCGWLAALPAVQRLEELHCGAVISAPLDANWWTGLLQHCIALRDLQLGLPLPMLHRILHSIPVASCQTLMVSCDAAQLEQAFPAMPVLQTLTWRHTQQSTLPAATLSATVLTALPQLSRLTVSYSPQRRAPANTICALLSLHHVRAALLELHVSYTTVSWADIERIAECRQLLNLSLYSVQRADDVPRNVGQALEVICQRCTQLQQVVIVDMSHTLVEPWQLHTPNDAVAFAHTLARTHVEKVGVCVDCSTLLVDQIWPPLLQCSALRQLLVYTLTSWVPAHHNLPPPTHRPPPPPAAMPCTPPNTTLHPQPRSTAPPNICPAYTQASSTTSLTPRLCTAYSPHPLTAPLCCATPRRCSTNAS